VPLAFGTDWPVSPLSPLHALHCALSRRPWAKGVPDQRLTLAEALATYAQMGAYASFAEQNRGTIAVGMAADLVLLSGNPEELANSAEACRVEQVFSAGRLAWAA
jgi:predicted amidohydrolase YtcJ